jgi:hypothetical protein
MGLWLVDNCQLEDLAAACERHGRWEFQLTIAPLRFNGVTGSPVNPLALFKRVSPGVPWRGDDGRLAKDLGSA